MSCQTKQIKFQLRRATAINWSSTNPILQAGEPGFDISNNCLKIGDGYTRWNSLPYLNSCGGGGGGSTGPTGPTGADSTVTGATGPTGPTGADSVVPGPTGTHGSQIFNGNLGGPTGDITGFIYSNYGATAQSGDYFLNTYDGKMSYLS